MDQIVNLLSNMFSRYSVGQRIVIVVVSLAMFAVITSIIMWGNRPEYDVLFPDVEPSEASLIVNEVRSQNIPYRIENNGRTILVPIEHSAELRLRVAELGIEPNGKEDGWELFDENNVAETSEAKRIRKQRALEGELAKTIRQFPSIKNCRVHLNLPENRIYESDQKGSASVALSMHAGRSISASQVKGITSLVASGVKGIQPEDVVVVDSEGNMLSDSSGDNAVMGSVGSQWELRNTVEEEYRKKVLTLVEGIVGRNKAVVEVSVELNFEQLERTAEFFDPENVVVLSEERHTETSSNSDSLSTSKENFANEDAIINYELNKTTEHFISNKGAIDRVSVAVLVDGIYKVSANEQDDRTTEYVARPQKDLTQISDLVAGAIGFNSDRGDKVEVKNLQFDRSSSTMDADFFLAAERHEMWEGIINKVLIGLSVLVAVFVMRKLIRTTTTVFPQLTNTPAAALPGGNGTAEQVLRLSEEDADFADDAFIAKLSPEARAKMKAKDRMTEDVVTYAKESPEDAARLLRSWLTQNA